MTISDLMIEVTRRCQIQCEHCLRGKAQSINMDIKHVETLFNQIESIGFITFTGGEPSLNTQCILDTLELCKEKNIEVSGFYIATNGVNISEDFIIACLKWYAYCKEKYICNVSVSNDYFHSVVASYNTELLDGLSFFSRKHSEESEYYEPISEGLAIENGYSKKNITSQQIEVEEDHNIISGELYLNCKGQIINGCDWSYENQENKVICNVEDFSEWIKNNSKSN